MHIFYYVDFPYIFFFKFIILQNIHFVSHPSRIYICTCSKRTSWKVNVGVLLLIGQPIFKFSFFSMFFFLILFLCTPFGSPVVDIKSTCTACAFCQTLVRRAEVYYYLGILLLATVYVFIIYIHITHTHYNIRIHGKIFNILTCPVVKGQRV